MNVLSSVVVESICCKVGNSEVEVRGIATLNAVNFISIGNSNAFTKVSGVVVVLGIKIELSFIQRVVLLLPKESIFKDTWLFVPPVHTSAVLLKDKVCWRILVIIVIHSIGNI